jgi:hypothetical protein
MKSMNAKSHTRETERGIEGLFDRRAIDMTAYDSHNQTSDWALEEGTNLNRRAKRKRTTRIVVCWHSQAAEQIPRAEPLKHLQNIIIGRECVGLNQETRNKSIDVPLLNLRAQIRR